MAASEAVNIAEIHAASEIRTVSLGDVRFDRSYQRDPSQKLVDDIAANWDKVSSELILVSDRGIRADGSGGLWVVNGQHRSLGARKRGIMEIDARVIDLSHVEDPAILEAKFRLRTNVRMADKPADRFKAQVRGGDEESLAIVKILESFGTEVNYAPSVDHGINAISTLEKIYRVDGTGGLLREVLELIRDIYGDVGGKKSGAATMLGLAWFVLKHGQDSDRQRLVDRLSILGWQALDRRARVHQGTMLGPIWLNYYRAIVETYNENLGQGKRLKWEQGGSSAWKMTAWGGG